MKVKLDDVIWAVYRLAINFDGQCPYCLVNTKGSTPEAKKDHFVLHHQKAKEPNHIKAGEE